MSETGMSHAIDARICRDEEEVDIGYKQPINEKNGYNQRVRFEDSNDKEMETLSHYTRKHWTRATTEVLVKRKAVEFLTVPPDHEWNRDRLREKPLPKIVEGFKDFGELRKIGTLQDDERILGVYEENGLEDSLELIASIGLGDNDKIVEIHSREVYTMLESFQAPEVTVETRYKTADKKVKPVAGPLPEDSKEQMGGASKEANEEEVDIGYKQPTNEKNGYNQRVHFEDYSDKKMKTLSHYTRKHWTRATTEVLVKGKLYGACPDVKIRIGDVATEQHFFVQDTTSYPLILEKPYIMTTWMEIKVLDDGSAYRDYGGTKEEVLSRDEGTFDASFIGILENGNIMYKKVDGFKRKERKRLYNIEGELRKLGTLQDDERILAVYEENGLEDSLELITSIGLGDNDKIVEIHSREVYTILESFQASEVIVETRYKTADKKVKPVAGPLPEDSNKQMGEHQKKQV
uniref:Predicted protein n=1 Tax=Physcomitrium patens TaxID=3218 RepID=A9TV04_PHYPA